eukprot:g8761.t1
MKFGWLRIKEHWDKICRYMDYCFLYTFESLRGCIISPFYTLTQKCWDRLGPLLRPKQQQTRGNIQRFERMKIQYCLYGSILSFYDTFHCVTGVPAFLLTGNESKIGVTDERVSTDVKKGDGKTDTHENDTQQLNINHCFAPRVPNSVREYAFSLDSSRFAVCYSNGEVIIWDTDHGTLITRVMIGCTDVSAVSFHGQSNSVLLVCTQNYKCWRWDLTIDNNPKCIEILDTRVVSSISGEVFSQRTDFFVDGKILLLSTIANCEHGLELRAVSVDTSLEPHKSRYFTCTPVSVEESFVISKVALSPDESGLIVGLIDEGMEDSQCVLWPNFKDHPAFHQKLSIGTIGSWSNDSKFVVTWTMIGLSNLEDDNRSTAFVWNVEDVRKKLKSHDDYSLIEDKIAIMNPYKDQVFWCHIVVTKDLSHRLIMGITGETIRFLYWHLELKIHTHVIETKISPRDMILCNREAWIQSYVNQMSVKGLAPMSVDKGGIFFGAVLGWPSEVFVWDVSLGVEVLKVSPRDLQDNQFKGGIDLIVSPTCEKFAIIGTNGAMVFCPSVLTKCEYRTVGFSETQMVKLKNQNISHRISDYKLKFSGDGDTIGVLCVGSSKMQAWNLRWGTTCIIHLTQLDGGSIRDFCLSHNGKHLATYTGKDIQVWKYEAKDINQPISRTNIDLEIVEMGIKDEALEIVLCDRDGSILIYHKHTMEENPDLDGEKDDASINNPLNEDNSGQNSASPRSDLSHPLLSHGNLANKTPLEGVAVDSLNKDYPLNKRVVLCGGAEDATFEISPSFKRVVRISEFGDVEAWDLETKQKIDSGLTNINYSKSYSDVFSRASSVSQQISEKLMSRRETLLDGTSISLTEQTTVVQSAKKHIVVAADASSSGLIQRSNRTSYDIEFEEEKHDNSHSVYVINLNNPKYRRRLSGKDLDPSKGLAISEDGRHVACFAGDYASTIVVWNAYSSDRLLPDYHFLDLNGAIENKEAIKKEIIPMIDIFGANFFQFRHPSGMSVLNEAMWYFKNELSKTILQYAAKKKIKLTFLLLKLPHIWTPMSDYHNAIEATIARRSPHTLMLMLKYLLERVTHETEVVTILKHSFIYILQEYPRIFLHIVKDFRILGLWHDIEVPESCLEERKFIAHTCEHLNLSGEETAKCWQEELKTDDENNQLNGPVIKAKATSLPYEGACNIGKEGLLHNLLSYRAPHSVFDSFLVKAIVNYKWEKYAKEMLVHELLYHCVMVLCFIVYCGFLCIEHTYVINTRDEKNAETEENSKSTRIALILCCTLAFPCLIREFRQCIVHTLDHGPFGVFYWLTSSWNLIEAFSYIMVVIIVPLGEYVILNEGDQMPILSALVAVESLLIWSRMLFYARPFRRTGPLVVTVAAIAKEIVYFLMLSLMIMFGFAMAFQVLYRHVGSSSINEDKNCEPCNQTTTNDTDDKYDAMHTAFGTFQKSFFTVFGYTFGEFDLEILYNAPRPITALMLFVLYVVIIAIILLNMLIALMSEKFTRMHKDKETRYIEAKARAIDDIDTMLSFTRKEQLRSEIKKCLQIAIPSHLHERMTNRSKSTRTKPKQIKETTETILPRTQSDVSQGKTLMSPLSQRTLGKNLRTQSTQLSGRNQLATISEPESTLVEYLAQAPVGYPVEASDWYDSDSTTSEIEHRYSDDDDF